MAGHRVFFFVGRTSLLFISRLFSSLCCILEDVGNGGPVLGLTWYMMDFF
jgi:hypothetical protein